MQKKSCPKATLFLILMSIVKDLKVLKVLNDFRVITPLQQLEQQPNVR